MFHVHLPILVDVTSHQLSLHFNQKHSLPLNLVMHNDDVKHVVMCILINLVLHSDVVEHVVVVMHILISLALQVLLNLKHSYQLHLKHSHQLHLKHSLAIQVLLNHPWQEFCHRAHGCSCAIT